MNDYKIPSMELDRIIDQATADVIGLTTGFEVERLKPGLAGFTGSREITGAMFLPGMNNAILTISLERTAAQRLISYMTGIMPDDLDDDDLCDGAAEMVNQIAGRIKSELAETDYHFFLTPPFTIVGPEHRMIFKRRIEHLIHDYSAGDIRFLVELSFIK